MKLGLSRTIFRAQQTGFDALQKGLGAVAMASVACLLGAALAHAQAAPQAAPKATPAQKVAAVKKAVAGSTASPAGKPLMAEQAFANVQVLKGIPADQFMDTMGFISASLLETCTYCHSDASESDWKHYADDTPRKRTARKMILMADAINKTYFAGTRVVTCYSCHNSMERPKVIPSLAAQYITPPDENPDTITESTPDAPAPDQIIDKYLQAIGGTQKLAALTSFVIKGNYEGYSETEKGTGEIYAKAPNLRSMILRTASGDTTLTFDGHTAWSAAPYDLSPIPVMALTGGDLDGARVDAEMSFPALIKQSLTKWRTGIDETIGDKDVQVIQGMSQLNRPVKLYFDSTSGLLVRMVRYVDTVIGRNPVQIDYSDYRDVSGIKIPFHQVTMWTDGRTTLDLTDVQLNVPIDAAKFAKPAPPPSESGAPKAAGQ